MINPRIVRSLLVLAAASAGSRPAAATSCAIQQITAPRSGQADVPLDTRLWFGYQLTDAPTTLRLVGPGGEVPLETRKVALTNWSLEALVATPKQPLSPSTSYVFEVKCGQPGCDSANPFTTGTAPAPTPALPIVRNQQPFTYDGPQDDDRAVLFEFDPQDLLVVVDVAGTSPFRADQPESALRSSWGVDRLWVGDKACDVPGARFPPDARGRSTDTAMVRFGRVDLAGNFSGWTEARSVTLPPAPGGCSAGGPAGSGAFSLAVALAAIAATRTRRARRRR